MIEILGKNGSGKSYISNKLYDMGFCRTPGYTSRIPRNGEIDGIDYHFVSRIEFNKLLEAENFIEYKFRNGNGYGIHKGELKENSILVGGNISQLSKISNISIIPIYIDCEIETRYGRVKERNGTTLELFERFHNENFSFLEDFEGYFVDNNLHDDSSIKKVLSIISNRHDVFNIKKIGNYQFIKKCVNDFSYDDMLCYSDLLLIYLKYEEYLIRKLAVSFDLTDISNYSLMKDIYFENMKNFMKDFQIKFEDVSNGFIIYINGINYESLFDDNKIKKLQIK